ncbi:MAG: hypothetical protein HKM22_03605, partial [Gammaproteobacteria bacterium]|nr:hypothetical protein [Gammaproteobacteria bacterium]
RLATGWTPDSNEINEPQVAGEWPEDLAQILYIDHYGNAISGLRASQLMPTQQLKVGEHLIGWARTFSDVSEGQAFWYENANGLVEIAVNCGRADALADLKLATAIQFV